LNALLNDVFFKLAFHEAVAEVLLSSGPESRQRFSAIFHSLSVHLPKICGSHPKSGMKDPLGHSFWMFHHIHAGSLRACGAAEQVNLLHSSQLRDVFDGRSNVSGGRMGVDPVVCRFVRMTVAVKINGPDVVTGLAQ